MIVKMYMSVLYFWILIELSVKLKMFRSYEEQFKEHGIWYEHRLIDDMVSQTRILSSTTLSTFPHLPAITIQWLCFEYVSLAFLSM